MLKFRPVTYSDYDLRSFKYTGSSSTSEGIFCKIAASSTRNTMTCTLFTSAGTMPVASGSATTSIYNRGEIFPVYLNDPDIENVGATIAKNAFVVGLLPRPGQEYEVHVTNTFRNSLTKYTIGGNVVVATNGKLCWASLSSTYNSNIIVGKCTGTYNNAWLRVATV